MAISVQYIKGATWKKMLNPIIQKAFFFTSYYA